jgi:dephospho-CoA kinase
MVQGGRFSEAQARARWQSQLPVAEKVRHGEVIDNSGSLDDLRARVGMLWEKIEEQLE